MLGRLSRSASSFVAVLAAYWLYALLVVPVIEPTVEARSVELTPEEKAAAQNSGLRHKHAFTKYFKAGEWELEGSPKVLESPQVKLLVQEYQNLPDGRVKLFPCTLLFFPQPGKKDAGGEEQVIIMRAPEGAILQFDEAFDLKRAKVGKLIGGKLVGKITIASAPTPPGEQEALLIVTRDVELQDNRVWTPHPVEFRLGQNHGSGRELRINLVKSADAPTRGAAADFGEIESFELMRDVRLHVEMDSAGGAAGMFGSTSRDKTPRGEPRANASPEPPVEVACRGPFKFDVGRSLASFSDQVDILRVHPEGPSDQLNCELLAIQFGPRERTAKANPRRNEKKAKENPFDVEPRRIEAVGDPVVIRAPSQMGHARCQRLEYEIKTGRIVLEGSENILLHQGSNELRTRRLEYRPGENGRLGWLEVAGPGWVQGALEDDPSQKFHAQWTKELRMRPHEHTQVVSMQGGAQVRFSDMGLLAADEIHLWLLEVETPKKTPTVSQVVTANYPGFAPGSIKDQAPPDVVKASPGKSDKDKPQLNVVPDRMMAQGHVKIDSPVLTGGTKRLEVWFQRPVAESADPSASRRATLPSNRTADGRSRTPTQSIDVRGDLIRLQMRLLEDAQRIDDVSIEGNARLAETRTRTPDELPLLVQGDRLQVAEADSDAARVNVAGRPASVEARGLTLIGARINLDRATNRLWIDGPGRMKLPMDRDLNGQALGQRQTMEVDWQGGMQFDGKTVTLDRTVVARGEHQTLKTESLQVSLRNRVDFNNPQVPNAPRSNAARVPGAGSEAADVEQVVCRGGVTLQNKTFDTDGQLSADQMQMREITINQVSGVIDGRGPGWITTVRRGAPPMASVGPLVGGALGNDAAAGQGKPGGFSYLNVRFEGPIGGNVHRQELTFSQQVRAVYGPVDDWRSELDPDTPDELGPQAVLLNCDRLAVRQMPALVKGGRATAELEAIGNTMVEGQTFTARAHKLAFAEAKDLLVLEGNGSADAQLFRQARPGGPTSQAAARRIMYWRSNNRVEVDDARFLDIGNLGGQPAGGNTGSTSNGGFPNLFPNLGDKNKSPAGPDARRSPRGNGTALPALRR